MSSKRRNNKKIMKEQRRAARYNQTNQESVAMQKSVNEVQETKETDEVVKVENPVVETVIQEAEEVSAAVESPVVSEVTEAKSEDKVKTVEHKLYIQYNDLEFSDELMFEAAVNAYCNEFNTDKSSIESVNLYVKPQEGKAYYVVNGDAEKSGSIEL